MPDGGIGHERDDTGTRRNGEAEIRGQNAAGRLQRAAGRDQMAEYRNRLRDVSVGAAFPELSLSKVSPDFRQVSAFLFFLTDT